MSPTPTAKPAVWVKSLIPGQTIVHVKVMDKFGLPYKEWNVVKQWYSIDDVSFTDDLVWDDVNDDGVVDAGEMVAPVNPVDSGHTFNVQVSGAKYVHVLLDVNGNGLMDDQALIGDRADLKAAAGFVAKMGAVSPNVLGWVAKAAGVDVAPGQVFRTAAGEPFYTRFADIELEGAEYWADILGNDVIDELWSGLEGKDVCFFTNIGPARGNLTNGDVAPASGEHGSG